MKHRSIIAKYLLIAIAALGSAHYYFAHILKGNSPLELLAVVILAWIVVVLFVTGFFKIKDK